MADETNQKQNEFKRPPVVVVLGHVDHGKTKILDYIRKTKVAEKESGGITQHIGAYQIEVAGKKITFLDTPGHEAFSAIRSRGAKVADIAVLVVAADDGVKPQTKEAIKHIQDAKIPFIVALNKIDKPEAKPAMARQQLAEAGVLVEGFGGQIPAIEISAKTGKGIDELLELILLTAELEDLKADPAQSGQGTVIESHLDKNRGIIATVIIQNGSLKLGDYVVSGKALAKIKMMEDFSRKRVLAALPSEPVLTLGWSESPGVGEIFRTAETKAEAEALIDKSLKVEEPLFDKEVELKQNGQGPEGARQGGPYGASKKNLNLVFKADTRSSLEAIAEAIKEIESQEVSYRVLGYGIGNINDNDINTVAPSRGSVYGFYVDIENSAKRLAEKEKIKIKIFDIIYELVEELRKDLSDLLEPEIRKTVLGKLRVLKLFKKGTNYQVVGGKVISGLVRRGALVDVLRNNVKIGSGRLAQLQHNKEEADEVREGLEAGIKFTGPAEIQESDTLEVYEEEKIKRSI